MAFVRISEWKPILSARGLTEDMALRAIDARLVPVYSEERSRLIWEDDLAAVPIAWSPAAAPEELPFSPVRSAKVADVTSWSQLQLANGIQVTLPPQRVQRSIPGLGPALRVLSRLDTVNSAGEVREIKWASGVRITVPGTKLLRSVQELSERMNRVSADRASELTKSAYYMGSKYSLSSFLVEGVASVLPPNGVVVDLMCGAGSATRAFSLNWSVLACDAMNFCTCLALSLGQPGEELSILNVVPRIHSEFRQNMESLEEVTEDLVAEEDALLHSPIGFEDGLGAMYAEFVERTPRFPEGGKSGKWSPADEVLLRRKASQARRTPYCLMLSYFSNVYFSIRQAMELDSLRFAIDQLEDEHLRSTALAGLVATASYIGTGYASQFAQPINVRGLSRRRLFALIERRAIRVFPEFVARLGALAGVAADTLHPVTSFTGVWEEALKKIPAFADGRPVCVYLDAPYTRDEYARYYHVLETLYRYHYPDAVGRGRVPNRKAGQIFQSPFFTRKDRTIGPLLSNIIVESLRQAEYCVWSHSSRARASIPAVVRSVVERGGILAESFSISHRYKGQGRSDRRVSALDSVDEYLLVFRRNDIVAAKTGQMN